MSGYFRSAQGPNIWRKIMNALKEANDLAIRPRRYAVACSLRRDPSRRAAINLFQTKLEIMSRPRRRAREWELHRD